MSKKREKEEQTLDEKLKMAIVPKEEEPYKVPDNWVWTRLGNIAPYIQRGKSPKYVDESPIYVISQKCVQWTGFELDKARYTSDEVKYTEERFLKEGDILWNSTGTGTVGRVCILENVDENQKMVADSHVTVVRIANNIISKCILNYLISNNVQNNLDSLTTGSTNQKELTLSSVKNLAIPLPPIDEQKRIVNKLDYFFDKIQKVKEIIEEVKEKNEARKESILSKAFTGELTAKWRADNNYTDVDILLKNIEDEKQNLIKEKVIKRPPKMEPLTEKDFFLDIPKNWKYVKLNDIAFVTKLAGFEYTKNIYPNLVNKGIPLFKGKNVQNGKIVYEFESYIPEEISNELIRSQINKKCLLTPYVGTIGNVALFDGDFKAHLGSNVGKIELFNNFNQNILEEYMLYYFRSCYGLAQLKKHKKATAQESISIEAIRDCVVIIPPIEEQKEIVRILDNIFTKENLINELISLEDKIQALEKSILSKAFRGELGTNSKDDIEAMELLKEILQK